MLDGNPLSHYVHIRMIEKSKAEVEESLSNRELEIVRLLAEGLSNREIAQKLFLSLETIKWYNKQIYNKLGVSSRTQAVAKVRETDLLDEPQATAHPSFSKSNKDNLPAEISSFIGRESEVSELRQLLQQARLITLTGPGGTGKTRLALRVASVSRDMYVDGVTFISLASTNDPLLVPVTIAKELGVVEQPNRPTYLSLQHYLENRHMLLVLDNFEQVLDAAPLVTDLLLSAPQLTVMTTSRAILQVRGEQEYFVPPLAIPNPEQVKSPADFHAFDAVELFSSRAQAVLPDFRLTDENIKVVAAICARLDGLPLAIELAVARLKLFGLQQLLQRLDSRLEVLKSGWQDLPDRQQSLRHTIDWSYNLLSADEQRLFAILGVFIGGRSLDAVVTVAGPGLHIDPLDGLHALLNNSLLYQVQGSDGHPRFFMLETIHEYALERLGDSGLEPLIRNRHLDYFLSLVEKIAPGYRLHNQLLLMESTEFELDNLRSALEWAFISGRYEDAARLVSSITDYFLYFGNRFVEGYRWANRVLAYLDKISPKYQIRLFISAGKLAYANGDLLLDRKYCLRAATLSQELGDIENEAWALIFGGGSAIKHLDNYEASFGMVEEGLTLLRRLGNKPGMAQALNILGEMSRSSGDYEYARQVYQESLVIVHQTGEIIRENFLIGGLSYVAYHYGDYEKAAALGKDALRQAHHLGLDRIVGCLADLSGPLCKLGEVEKAARLLACSKAHMAEIGIDYQPGDKLELEKFAADIRANLDQPTFDAAWKEGEALSLDQAVSYALAV